MTEQTKREIEKMAIVAAQCFIGNDQGCGQCIPKRCLAYQYSKRLYKAGYRKNAKEK